ncbi:MAG: hypothetical protein AMXMBFR74_21030 [Parvibaculum sp.]
MASAGTAGGAAGTFSCWKEGAGSEKGFDMGAESNRNGGHRKGGIAMAVAPHPRPEKSCAKRL